jgi:hypothetical protein
VTRYKPLERRAQRLRVLSSGAVKLLVALNHEAVRSPVASRISNSHCKTSISRETAYDLSEPFSWVFEIGVKGRIGDLKNSSGGKVRNSTSQAGARSFSGGSPLQRLSSPLTSLVDKESEQDVG